MPKKTGDLRPVIDLSTLNRYMTVPHFKMETQGSVQSAMRSQEWTVSIDIRDAYLHVPMHQAVRKYLCFVVNKKVYQFNCLLFGLATRLTLDTGTVVSISMIVPHKRSGDAGRHLCCERLPTSSEVPGGSIDVRQRSDGGLHQERGGHEIAHFDADDHTAAQVV